MLAMAWNYLKKNRIWKKQWHSKTISAHRWMYTQRVGSIPYGMVINHLCRNRACVNPRHLEVTTQAKNCRYGIGTKLSENQVIEIKAALPMKRRGDGSALARKYGVSSSLIHDIWKGRAWRI